MNIFPKSTGDVWIVVLALFVATGCSSALEPDAAEESTLDRARASLVSHEVEQAQSLYADVLAEDPTRGDAAVGKALTDLLLLGEAPELEPVWLGFFAADNSPDTEDLLYRDGGLFYWMSRGVPWGDDGEYAGLKSLVADRLPWPTERLDSLHAFTRSMNQMTGEGIDDLVGLADALAQVEDELRIAIEDDRFQTFVLPGDVFHADDVDVVLGRTEVSALAALVSTMRGIIYFNAAYAHGWTPEDAVVPVEDDGAHIDHAAGYLDTRVFRVVDEPERLGDAREAFAGALRSLRGSVQTGGASTRKTALNWRMLSEEERDQTVELLNSVEESLYGRTAVPYTAPATTMDLSVFFEEGRVLPAEDSDGAPFYWLSPMSPEDDSDEEVMSGWAWNDAALQEVLVDGVFDPTFRVGDSERPELRVSGNVSDDLISVVAGDLSRDVQKTY